MNKSRNNAFSQKKITAPNKKNIKNLDQGRKKLAAWDKRSWFYQDHFWDEIEERNTKNEK